MTTRREFMMAAGACTLPTPAPGQNAASQPFLAGIVPGSRARGATTLEAKMENFWLVCDECRTLQVHHIEVNNTYGQIVQGYDNRIPEFLEGMEKRQLRLLGLAMYSHLHRTELRGEMIAEHLRVARFLKSVGGKYIAGLIAPAEHLGNGDEESYRRVDAKAVVANCNDIGRRVKQETGIDVGYHPEQGDIRAGFWTAMVEDTDPRYFKFWPDVGHLVACGVDPLETYRKYRSRMVGTHLRDFTPGAQGERGRMVPFGTGIIRLPELVQYLRDTKFAGCVMGEGGGSQAMRNYMAQTLNLNL